jgi:uncharacterized repeat protein (TIGR03806 family)
MASRTVAVPIALFLLQAGCVDQPNPVAPPGGTAPVDRLSQMGIYQGNLADLVPVAGIVAYDVNVSLYADGAQKHRFVFVPPGTHVQTTADRWIAPVGAYFIKNFYFQNDARDPSQGIHLIETRFLIQGDAGLTVSTYLWNDQQTDAVASGGNVDLPVRWIDQNGVLQDSYFHVPGTSQCQSCHDDRQLGWRTRQMDHPGSYGDGTSDQISHLIAAGILDQAPPDGGIVLSDPFGTAPLDARARSYLDANCAHCHATVGEASGTGLFWDYEDTTPELLPLCRPSHPVNGNDHVIVPGHPEQSEFISRMLSSDPFAHMPQGPSHIPDGAAIAVLSQWVSAMSPQGCP